MRVKQSNAINQISRELGSVSRRTKLPVTEQNDGLMTAEAYRQLAQTHRQLENLPDETDILFVEPGYYAVYNPKNSPLDNPSRFFVDVKISPEGDKVIKATALYTGRIWTMAIRATNESPDIPNLWTESTSERVLWVGSATAVGTTIDLLDNLATYDGIDVIYTIGSTQQMARIRSVNTDGSFYIPNTVVINGSNINRDTVSNLWYPTRLELKRTKENQLTIDFYKLYTINVDKMTAVMTHDTGDFSINAIIGLK